jgi:hypothetical protein
MATVEPTPVTEVLCDECGEAADEFAPVVGTLVCTRCARRPGALVRSVLRGLETNLREQARRSYALADITSKDHPEHHFAEGRANGLALAANAIERAWLDAHALKDV